MTGQAPPCYCEIYIQYKGTTSLDMSQNSKKDLGKVLGLILGREKCLLNCTPVPPLWERVLSPAFQVVPPLWRRVQNAGEQWGEVGIVRLISLLTDWQDTLYSTWRLRKLFSESSHSMPWQHGIRLHCRYTSSTIRKNFTKPTLWVILSLCNWFINNVNWSKLFLTRPKISDLDSPHFLYQAIGILRLIFASRRSDDAREDIDRLASHSERRWAWAILMHERGAPNWIGSWKMYSTEQTAFLC